MGELTQLNPDYQVFTSFLTGELFDKQDIILPTYDVPLPVRYSDEKFTEAKRVATSVGAKGMATFINDIRPALLEYAQDNQMSMTLNFKPDAKGAFDYAGSAANALLFGNQAKDVMTIVNHVSDMRQAIDS